MRLVQSRWLCPRRFFFFLPESLAVKIAYIDESGTPELTGATSHFVLLAVTLDAQKWKLRDQAIAEIKGRYGVEGAELHAGWMARKYVEQELVSGFAGLSSEERTLRALRKREELLLRRAALR